MLLLLTSFTGKADQRKPALSGSHPQVTGVVMTADGTVQGVLTADGKVCVYAGIPFSAPPIGDLRWREPQPVKPWVEVLKADHFGPVAMQPRLPLFIENCIAKKMGQPKKKYQETMSEDCLYLNVWAPADSTRKNYPVLVYFHGGSLRSGSGSEPLFSGEEAARSGGVVMVSANYRLGAFGYLALPELNEESGHGSGNYGLLDQIAALRWVQKNIAAFGGDPNRVTIAGESAGSQSVSALCASPLAKGLFHGAIGESAKFAAPSLASDLFTQHKADSIGRLFMKEHKAATPADLRRMPADKLMKHELKEVSIVVNGYALPRPVYDIYADGEQNDVPLLVGYNANEGIFFALALNPTPKEYPQLLAKTFGAKADKVQALFPAETKEQAKAAVEHITGIYAIGWPTREWAKVQTRTGRQPAYLYYFSWGKDSGLRATHGTEMVYAYYCPDAQGHWTDADREFSRKMFTYWMNFVKTGKPSGGGLPEWKAFAEAPDETMELGEHFGMTEEPNLELMMVMEE